MAELAAQEARVAAAQEETAPVDHLVVVMLVVQVEMELAPVGELAVWDQSKTSLLEVVQVLYQAAAAAAVFGSTVVMESVVSVGMEK